MTSTIKEIIFLLILSFSQITFSSIQNYTCEISDETCILQNLHLTSSDKHFKLDPNEVVIKIEDVWIRSSKIEILTSDICQTLPYIKVFDISKVGLIGVDKNALDVCKKLEIIDLNGNYLTQLPSEMFQWNTELQYVFLWNNKITEIDEKLFKYNKKLIKISLNGNALKTLPSNLFNNLINLKYLWIQGNQISDVLFLEETNSMKNLMEIRLDFNKLSDIDVLALYTNFPGLKEININENEFWCPRLEQIKEILRDKGIIYDENIMSGCINDKKDWETKRSVKKAESVVKNNPQDIKTKPTQSIKDEL